MPRSVINDQLFHPPVVTYIVRSSVERLSDEENVFVRRTFMPSLSRRDLLRAGAAVSASPLATKSPLGRTNILFAEPTGLDASAAVAPRERLLLDFDWKFQFGHGSDPARDLGLGSKQEDFAKS